MSAPKNRSRPWTQSSWIACSWILADPIGLTDSSDQPARRPGVSSAWTKVQYAAEPFEQNVSARSAIPCTTEL